MRRRLTKLSSAWAAGLLDGRGTVDVRRVVTKGKCFLTPRVAWEFPTTDVKILDDLKAITGGVVRRGGLPGFTRFEVTGFKKVDQLSRAVAPHMRNEAKKCRLLAISKRASKPNPSICTAEEAKAKVGELSPIFFKG